MTYERRAADLSLKKSRLLASRQEVVQLLPLCVSGSQFVYTCYLVLHLSFQKSEQVPVIKVYKIVFFVVSELHGRVASQAGSAKKPVALRHMPVPAILLYTVWSPCSNACTKRQPPFKRGCPMFRTQEPFVQQPVLLSFNAH